jgi:hypothetical protein
VAEQSLETQSSSIVPRDSFFYLAARRNAHRPANVYRELVVSNGSLSADGPFSAHSSSLGSSSGNG